MGTITLRHLNHTLPRRMEPFYDGSAVAVNGALTLPADNMLHIRAAFMRGYKKRLDGTPLRDEVELEEYIRSQSL